jgi:hypothetical protein
VIGNVCLGALFYFLLRDFSFCFYCLFMACDDCRHPIFFLLRSSRCAVRTVRMAFRTR